MRANRMLAKAMIVTGMMGLVDPANGQIFSPNYPWVNNYGASGGAQEGRSIDVARDDDLLVTRIYAAGTFTGSITIGSTTLNSAGGSDIWIARYNTSGSVLSVAHYGTSNDDIVNDLDAPGRFSAASNSKVYICGSSDGVPLILGYAMSLSGTPVQATFDWAVGEASSIAISTNGVVFCTGFGYGGITYNNGSGNVDLSLPSGCGGGSLFVVRLSPALAFTHALAPNIAGCATPKDMAIYNSRAYITGWYSGTVRFTAAASSQLPAVQGARDIFVCSMSAPVTVGSVPVFHASDQKAAGSGASEGGSNPFREMGYSVIANANGVYVGGVCTSGAVFKVNAPVVQVDQAGPFLAHYAISGGAMQPCDWARGCFYSGGNLQYTWSGYYGLASNGSLVWAVGNARNLGSIQGTGGTAVQMPGTGMNSGNSGILACFTSTGAIRWANIYRQNWASSDPVSSGKSVVSDGCDLYMTGHLSGSPFHFGNAPINIAGGSIDAFVAKASSQFAISANQTYTIPSGTSLNTTASVVAQGATGYNWSISPIIPFGGQGTSTINFTLSTAGTYTITCTTTGGACPTTSSTRYTLVIAPGQAVQNGGDREVYNEPSENDPVLYPNPALNGMRVFGLPMQEGSTIAEFWSMSGQLTQALPVAADGQVTWSADALPSGMYMCRITREGQALFSQRLIVGR